MIGINKKSLSLFKNIQSSPSLCKSIQASSRQPKQPVKTHRRSMSTLKETSHFDFNFQHNLDFVSAIEKFKCYRVLDENGVVINKDYKHEIEDEQLIKIYDTMVTINEIDNVLLQAQR